jgi:hypothetical protein
VVELVLGRFVGNRLVEELRAKLDPTEAVLKDVANVVGSDESLVRRDVLDVIAVLHILV